MGEEKYFMMVWTVERMGEEQLTKKVYNSEIGGTGVRGRPPVRRINRVEYCRE